MTASSEAPLDEHELVRLREDVDRAQDILNTLREGCPPIVWVKLPPSLQQESDERIFKAQQDLYAAKTKHASAEATLAKKDRISAEEAVRRTIDANERMADASKAAAESSAAAAKWAKWAAVATAIAALASLAAPFVQRK